MVHEVIQFEELALPGSDMSDSTVDGYFLRSLDLQCWPTYLHTCFLRLLAQGH